MMRLSRRFRFSLQSKQTGVALFISLVLLLVMTIIGVSAVQTTSLEERMARNARDRVLAFQAAESAIRDAETFLDGITNRSGFDDTGTDGLWNAADLGDPERWSDDSVWEDARTRSAATALAGLSAQPRYMVEYVATLVREENAYQQDSGPYGNSGGADTIDIFRVTALGQGGSETATVMLQSTYGRILN